MKRFFCPKCNKVRRSNKVSVAAGHEVHEHVTVSGVRIKVPVQNCFRHRP